MESFSKPKGKRRHPRISMNLPVDLQVEGELSTSPGLVINLSEAGLLVQSFRELPVGAKIILAASLSKGSLCEKIVAVAEIVWRDVYLWDDWEAYQYGLKLLQISDENYRKLKKIIGNRPNSEKIPL